MPTRPMGCLALLLVGCLVPNGDWDAPDVVTAETVGTATAETGGAATTSVETTSTDGTDPTGSGSGTTTAATSTSADASSSSTGGADDPRRPTMAYYDASNDQPLAWDGGPIVVDPGVELTVVLELEDTSQLLEMGLTLYRDGETTILIQGREANPPFSLFSDVNGDYQECRDQADGPVCMRELGSGAYLLRVRLDWSDIPFTVEEYVFEVMYR